MERVGGWAEDKRFILVGQRTLFERSYAALCELFEQVYVVIAQDSSSLQVKVPVIRDLIPDCGSLGGLYTGLRQAKTQHIFLAACDMPFMDPDLIRYMVQFKGQADIVIGRWADSFAANPCGVWPRVPSSSRGNDEPPQ